MQAGLSQSVERPRSGDGRAVPCFFEPALLPAPLGDAEPGNAQQHGLQSGGGRLGMQARLLPGDRVELCLSDDGLGKAVVRAVAVDL